jgi:hypothetical protein
MYAFATRKTICNAVNELSGRPWVIHFELNISSWINFIGDTPDFLSKLIDN